MICVVIEIIDCFQTKINYTEILLVFYQLLTMKREEYRCIVVFFLKLKTTNYRHFFSFDKMKTLTFYSSTSALNKKNNDR